MKINLELKLLIQKLKDMSYKDKNKTYITLGNEDLDKLLFMLESTSVISDSFKTRITNLALWILTNHENHVSEIKEEMKKLYEEMKWVNIFSEYFMTEINYLLIRGLEFEINKK